jgi:hypothetical protein
VENSDGAAVRIAMTVGAPGQGTGRLLTVSGEQDGGGEGLEVTLDERRGLIYADLTIGANVAATQPLQSNGRISFRGVTLMGSGFWVQPDDPLVIQERGILKPLRNGKDLTDRPRNVFAIDFFGLSADEARACWPAAFQRVLDGVKPERDQSQRASYRQKWWLFAEARPDLRNSIIGIRRYIASPMTAKHRTFQFLDSDVLPDQGLIAIAIDDAYILGVLSSRVHVIWALAQGGTLEDRPRYNNSRCFETFPFPDLPPPQPSLQLSPTGREGNGFPLPLAGEGQGRGLARIRDLAEQLDAHRKRVLAAHPELTQTGLYNVLEKLRSGAALNEKEQRIHELGLVAVLKSFHDDLDAAVLEAYGWNDLISALPAFGFAQATAGEVSLAETLLERLVALNAERAREEAQGQVRWLRPDFQHPQATPQQQTLDATREDAEAAPVAAIRQKIPWPAELPAQMAAVAQVLASAGGPLSMDQLAEHFSGKGAWKKRLPQLVETLVALGRAERDRTGSSSHVGWVSGFIA